MESKNLVATLLLGAGGSLVGSIVLAIGGQPLPVVVPLLAVALFLLLLHSWSLRRARQTLRAIGIRDWESSMVHGTTTERVIGRSQQSIEFMGIAGTKWLKMEHELKRMLRRHATNGGRTRFLLLDPDSLACQRFEAIKGSEPGSLAAIIRKNLKLLEDLADDNLPIEVRLYSAMPRFRLVFQDGNLLVLGLYSFTSDAGVDSPQLLLAAEEGREWSFFFGFKALFESRWEPPEVVRAERPGTDEGS